MLQNKLFVITGMQKGINLSTNGKEVSYETIEKRLSEDEKKEYLNEFCHQFQSCSYGKDSISI